jgi:hypothetical protein
MLPTEELFVSVYVLVHDLILSGAVRATMPSVLRKVIAQWRNRIENTFSEITDQMELARHGAHTFWALLTRAAATIAAHTLRLVCLTHE